MPRHPLHIYVNEFTAGVYASVAPLPEGGDALGDKSRRPRGGGEDEGDADGRQTVRQGRIREDGSVIHPIYLLAGEDAGRVLKGEWDYFKLVATLPGEQAFGPLNKACPLVPG